MCVHAICVFFFQIKNKNRAKDLKQVLKSTWKTFERLKETKLKLSQLTNSFRNSKFIIEITQCLCVCEQTKLNQINVKKRKKLKLMSEKWTQDNTLTLSAIIEQVEIVQEKKTKHFWKKSKLSDSQWSHCSVKISTISMLKIVNKYFAKSYDQNSMPIQNYKNF